MWMHYKIIFIIQEFFRHLRSAVSLVSPVSSVFLRRVEEFFFSLLNRSKFDNGSHCHNYCYQPRWWSSWKIREKNWKVFYTCHSRIVPWCTYCWKMRKIRSNEPSLLSIMILCSLRGKKNIECIGFRIAANMCDMARWTNFTLVLVLF